MSDAGHLNWYIVMSRPLSERKLSNGIEQLMQDEFLKDLIVDVFLPSQTLENNTSSKNKKSKEKILMSGYVFVKMNPVKECLDAVANLDGFLSFLGRDKTGNMSPVPKSEMDRMSRAVEDKKSQQAEPSYFLGQRVKVMGGHFAGLSGTIESFDSESGRVQVLVPVLGKHVSADLSVDQIVMD